MPFCPFCGSSMSPTQSFCEACGNRVLNRSLPPATAVTHPQSVGGEREQTAKILGIISICVGVASFLFCPIGLGLIGIILGAISVIAGESKTLGITGTLLSFIGMVVGSILSIFSALLSLAGG